MDSPPPVFTPQTLAVRWACSARHVRNLINHGHLRAFYLGGKLLRIPSQAVEDFEQCQNSTLSDALEANSASPTTTIAESVIGMGSAPVTRMRLNAVRRRLSQNRSE